MLRTFFLLLAATALGAVLGIVLYWQDQQNSTPSKLTVNSATTRPAPSDVPPPPPSLPEEEEDSTSQFPSIPAEALSPLATAPSWNVLNRWQTSTSRSRFLREISRIYTHNPIWKNKFHLDKTDVLVNTGVPGNYFRLQLANTGQEQVPTRRQWRTATEMTPAPNDKPLEGVRIAIDPGHIGGEWAKLEERWFQIGDDAPVAEGDMTLYLARILAPKLRNLGAVVTLVRTTDTPTTEKRPEDFLTPEQQGDEEAMAGAARLFYRTAEIRARANKINRVIQPDIVLCLHFNASAWGDPEQPTLSDGNHFHLLLNGAYTADELTLADQRYELLYRLLSDMHREEVKLALSMANTFREKTKLPPFLYPVDSPAAINVSGNPYLWARNLLANRIYHAPVLYFEPYVMNSIQDYPRIQAGDYLGTRKIAGVERPSIYREYADAVAEGLSRYYSAYRPKANPLDSAE